MRPAETLKYGPQGNGAFAGIVRVKTADEITQVGGRPQVRRARLGERRRPGGGEEGGVSAGTGHAAQGTWRHHEPGDRHGGSSPGACAAQPPAGDLQPGPRPRPAERGPRPFRGSPPQAAPGSRAGASSTPARREDTARVHRHYRLRFLWLLSWEKRPENRALAGKARARNVASGFEIQPGAQEP